MRLSYRSLNTTSSEVGRAYNGRPIVEINSLGSSDPVCIAC
jgi:hypothetical protein